MLKQNLYFKNIFFKNVTLSTGNDLLHVFQGNFYVKNILFFECSASKYFM